MKETVNTILGLIGPATITSIITYFLTKKKYNAEVKTDEIENLKRTLEFYQKFIQDSDSRLESYIRRGEDDRVEIYKLQDTVQCLLKISCVDKECSNRRYMPLGEIESQMIRRKPTKKDSNSAG